MIEQLQQVSYRCKKFEYGNWEVEEDHKRWNKKAKKMSQNVRKKYEANTTLN